MVKRLPAGMFRHTISIQSQGSTYNSYGQVANTTADWTTDKTVRAHISPLKVSDDVLAQQGVQLSQYRVTIDYLSTMDGTDAIARRVLLGSRVLSIKAVNNPDEENFLHELICVEEK